MLLKINSLVINKVAMSLYDIMKENMPLHLGVSDCFIKGIDLLPWRDPSQHGMCCLENWFAANLRGVIGLASYFESLIVTSQPIRVHGM